MKDTQAPDMVRQFRRVKNVRYKIDIFDYSRIIIVKIEKYYFCAMIFT